MSNNIPKSRVGKVRQEASISSVYFFQTPKGTIALEGDTGAAISALLEECNMRASDLYKAITEGAVLLGELDALRAKWDSVPWACIYTLVDNTRGHDNPFVAADSASVQQFLWSVEIASSANKPNEATK